jgi:diguanylate cyclase (GGDEF)-like protein/hemerythrin-like metal-binding protein
MIDSATALMSLGSFFRQQASDEASDLLSLLSKSNGFGIAVKGLDGRYQLTNTRMQTLVGKSAEQIIGVTDEDLFSPQIAAQLEPSDRAVSDGAGAAKIELDVSTEGISRHCLWLKYPVLGSDGNLLAIGGLILDISQKQSVSQSWRSLEQLQHTNHELQKTLAELDRLASTDKLTGAWNRRRLEEAVTNEMERLKRYDHPVSLMIVDIDFFKKVNDEHGHVVGDLVLRQLAKLLQSNVRIMDSLTRWGGDEFVVLCPNTTLSTATIFGKRLRDKIAREAFPAVINITASIGVAECLPGEVCEQWFARADSALYRAKACGRNQIQVAPQTPQRVGAGEHVAANFVLLAWHQAYESGHPLIDHQHRALFAHANKLLAATLSRRPTDEVAAVIDALVHEIVQHFVDEELIFTAAGFPGAAEHAAIHRDLADRAVQLVGNFHAGNLGIGELFQFLAHDVVARHMLGSDREFFPYLSSIDVEAFPTGRVK